MCRYGSASTASDCCRSSGANYPSSSARLGGSNCTNASMPRLNGRPCPNAPTMRLRTTGCSGRAAAWSRGRFTMDIDLRVRRQVDIQPYPLVFVTISGAHLYGFPSPDSDYDLRGVHVLPANEVVGLDEGRQTIEVSGV